LLFTISFQSAIGSKEIWHKEILATIIRKLIWSWLEIYISFRKFYNLLSTII